MYSCRNDDLRGRWIIMTTLQEYFPANKSDRRLDSGIGTIGIKPAYSPR